jgi:hypothetical protein
MLGEPLSDVSYHIRYLLKYECVRLVETRSVRGAVEHFYVARGPSLLGSRSWTDVPVSLRGDVAMVALDQLVKRLQAALELSTYNRRRGARLVCATVHVDEEGWKEIAKIVDTAERSFQRAAKRCEERLQGEPGFPIVLALGFFEAAHGDKSDGRAP